MKARLSIVFLALLLVLSASAIVYGGATRVSGAIWVDGELYDTVLTDATFVSPPAHSTDMIYSFMMSGLQGQRAVADSAPGDRDYNGGRWSVNMVVFTEQGIAAHDPDGDEMVNFELTSEEDVLAHEQLGHIIITPANFYFECPLLPRHGNR